MINPDEVRKKTQEMYGEDTLTLWVCLPTHRLDPLVTSTVFSPLHAKVLEIDAGGSIGHQVSDVLSWGRWVGDVNHERASRNFYRKWYLSKELDPTEPQLRIKDLSMQYHSSGVKRPVIHNIRIKRDGLDMFWMYTHFFKDHVKGMKKLKDLAGDQLEKSFYTLDLYMISDINLDDEFNEDAIRQAHDPDFISKRVWRALMTAHGIPSVLTRDQRPERAVEITDATHLSAWVVDYQRKIEREKLRKEEEERLKKQKEEENKRKKYKRI